MPDYTQTPQASPALQYGQQSTIASDIGQGFMLGNQIGSGIRMRRDERRKQREVDRIISKMEMSPEELPNPKLVQALGKVAGPEFANQWLDIHGQMKQMSEEERVRKRSELMNQTMFEMSLFEGLKQLPREQRAQSYVNTMNRYIENPQSRNMAMASMQAFLGPAMNGQLPDLGDQNINSMLTQQRYMLDGINIMKDIRSMQAKESEIAAEGAQARATADQENQFIKSEAALDRTAAVNEANAQRDFIRNQNFQDRTAANIESSRQRAHELLLEKIKAASKKVTASGSGISRKPEETKDEHAARVVRQYNGTPGDFYILFYQPDLAVPMSDEDGNTLSMMNINGEKLDLGTFFDKEWRQLATDDPMSQFIGGSTGDNDSPTIKRREWLRGMGTRQ